MGVSPLSDKSIRRIARTTGLPVIYAYGRGGMWHSFVTEDHRHGSWNRRTHEWAWAHPPAPNVSVCSSSCRTRFRNEPVLTTPEESGVVHHTCTCGHCPLSEGVVS